MNSSKTLLLATALAPLLVLSGAQAQQQPAAAPPPLPQAPDMTFFVTGAGPGKGADLGGIAGADQHCQTLAQRHGAGGKTWRAYLSTQEAGGKPAVNARDRVGKGPWQNFKGEVVATSVDDLHSDNNKLGFNTSLSERGLIIPGVGFAPNRHDVLTGSTPEGRAFPAGEDRTCRNWTQQHPGRRDGRPYRPQGIARRCAVAVVEFVASLARARRRLQPSRSARHRRRRPVLLLRRQLGGRGSGSLVRSAPSP